MDTQSTFPFAIGTFWTTAARMQLETLNLMARRAQAYVDLPAQFARCKTQDELLAEQTRFWEVAQREYLDRFETALSALPLPPLVEVGRTKGISRQRDYLTVPSAQVASPVVSPAEGSRAAAAEKVPAQPLRRSA